jgi:O-antigen/teichoic acid export membrane protein
MREESASTSAIYNVARTLIVFAFGLALAVLVPRWLGPSEYAAYRMVVQFLVTAIALARLSLDTAASRFVAEMRGKGMSDEAASVARMLLRWEIGISSVVCLALLALRPLLSTSYGLGERGWLIVVAAAAVAPEAIGLVLGGVLKGSGRYRYLARLSFWTSPLTFCASVAAMRAGFGVLGLLVVRLLVSAIRLALLSRGAAIRRSAPTPTDDALRRRLIGFIVLWSWFMIVDMIVWEQSELYFLGLFWGTGEQVAFYGLAFDLSARAMTLLPLAVGDVMIPAASRAFGRGGMAALGRVYRLSTRYLVLLAVPVAAAGVVLADLVIRLGVGSRFAPAVPLLRVLLVSAALGSIGQGSWAVLTAGERRRFLLVMGTAAVAVNLSLDLLLIPAYAAWGAVAANLVAQALAVAGGAAYTCRALRVSFPWASVGHALVASIPAGVCLFAGIRFVTWPFGLALGCVAAGVMYPAGLLLLGAIRPEDIDKVGPAIELLPTRVRRHLLSALRNRICGTSSHQHDAL